MAALTFRRLKDEYAALWHSMIVRPDKRAALERIARKLIAGKPRYQMVADKTGVPWAAIALIHQMECGGDWSLTGLSCDAWKTPDNASLAMNGKLTSVVFQPAPLAAGEPAPQFSAGGVASRLRVTDWFAMPPLEATLQLNVTPAVSAVTAASSQPSMWVSESGSLTCQVSCTLLRYQPLLPRVPEME